MKRAWIGLGLFVLVSACSRSSTSPAVIADFSIVVSSINTNVLLGATEQMAAAASDGHALAGTWGTDTPTVATVNAAGLVTAVSSGLANIFFIAEGRQGTKAIRALPNLAGTFNGNYRITSCTQSGQMATLNICGQAPPGTLVPYTFIFTQTGTILAGRVLISGIDAVPAFSASIGVNGSVSVTGTVSASGYTIDSTWELSQRTAGVTTGTIAQVWTAPGFLTGQINITGSIDSIAKTASAGD